jgi:hypothetical protein
MSSIRIKVTASPVTLTVDKSDYQERWAEHCVENDDVGEGQSAGEPSDEFVIECVQDEIDAGERGLDEVLESAIIDLELVPE